MPDNSQVLVTQVPVRQGPARQGPARQGQPSADTSSAGGCGPATAWHHVVTRLTCATVLMTGLAACNPNSSGFALPPGDAEAGSRTFVELACQHCHSVANDHSKFSDGHAEIHFVLGGRTTRVRSYGDLVTSIINPSHKISGYPPSDTHTDADGQSNMQVYNDVMTVQQLIDLTTYLQNSYEIVQPQYQPYYYAH